MSNNSPTVLNSCSSCGQPSAPEMKFCLHCGVPITAQQEAGRAFCGSCGSSNTTDSRFCQTCGAQVKNGKQAAAVGPPQIEEKLKGFHYRLTALCPHCGYRGIMGWNGYRSWMSNWLFIPLAMLGLLPALICFWIDSKKRRYGAQCPKCDASVALEMSAAQTTKGTLGVPQYFDANGQRVSDMGVLALSLKLAVKWAAIGVAGLIGTCIVIYVGGTLVEKAGWVEPDPTTEKSSAQSKMDASSRAAANPAICIVAGTTSNRVEDKALFDVSEQFAAAVAANLQTNSRLVSAGMRFRPVEKISAGCTLFIESVPQTMNPSGQGFDINLYVGLARELQPQEDRNVNMDEHSRSIWGTAVFAHFTAGSLAAAASQTAERIAPLLLHNTELGKQLEAEEAAHKEQARDAIRDRFEASAYGKALYWVIYKHRIWQYEQVHPSPLPSEKAPVEATAATRAKCIVRYITPKDPDNLPADEEAAIKMIIRDLATKESIENHAVAATYALMDSQCMQDGK